MYRDTYQLVAFFVLVLLLAVVVVVVVVVLGYLTLGSRGRTRRRIWTSVRFPTNTTFRMQLLRLLALVIMPTHPRPGLNDNQRSLV